MKKEFITKDQWDHKEFSTWMMRDTNKWKPRFDLLILDWLPYEEQPLTLLANLLARWAEKYSERNRERASTQEEYNRFKESFLRHGIQASCWELDEDHISWAIFNLMWMALVRYRMNNDN
jgi:hypothetical protein